MQKILFIFIGLLIILFALPVYADAADDDKGLEDSMTFHVYDDVDLVSTLKFEYGKPRIVIKSVYPQLASEMPRDGVETFNAISLQIVKDEISRYRSLVKENADLQNKMDKKTISNHLYIDYNTSYLKPSRDHIISVRFGVQGYIGGKKFPYHEYTALNYNLDKNQKIELSDLFISDSNYLDIMSRYVYGVLQKRFQSITRTSGAAPRMENYSVFNIKPNGLLITFNESQVVPRALGAQTVLIPWSVVVRVISPDSVIATCIDHPTKCLRHNLLTGGFIDEADASKKENMQRLATNSGFLFDRFFNYLYSFQR